MLFHANNHDLSPNIAYNQNFNTTNSTNRAGTCYLSGSTYVHLVYCWVRVAQS